MAANPPKESIRALVPGAKDHSGNEVLHVLASGNEYAIYEIKHPDINYRLRVFLDGYTDQSEQVLADRFARVKQKYIEAKGLLYRSPNFGMMKNRVAHALATALSSDVVDPTSEFDALINALKKEAILALTNRLAYVLPTIVFTITNAFIAVCAMHVRTTHPHFWQIGCVLLATSLGSTMSILIGAKNLQFEEYPNWFHYLYIGLVRVFLACVAGTIAYILIRAKFIFPQILESDFWKAMAVVIVAAFSETFVPNMLSRAEKKEATDDK